MNFLSIHATYCVIVAGASPGETIMWAAVRENFDFLTVVNYTILSQYSTVVLTVVRVMIAKYRKSGIWGYRSSLTPEPVELK